MRHNIEWYKQQRLDQRQKQYEMVETIKDPKELKEALKHEYDNHGLFWKVFQIYEKLCKGGS